MLASADDCESTLTVEPGFRVGVKSVSFSLMGDVIAAGCDNGKIHLLDAVTGAVKRSLSGHTDPVLVERAHTTPVLSVCFSPCGTKIVSGGGKETDWFSNCWSNEVWEIFETCRIWDT
jgi:WD40 repeat protein